MGRVGSNEESEMPAYWFIILSKHELRGLIMTQGRFERQRERDSLLCVLQPARTSLVICKQVTMQARCMSICTNEQGKERGRGRKSEERGKMGGGVESGAGGESN